MNIDDVYRRCVVFLCTEEVINGVPSKVPKGTAFFVGARFSDGMGLHWYLVTATHNLNHIRKNGGKYFISLNKTENGKVYLERNDIDKWTSHASADVSVIHFDDGLRNNGTEGDFDIASIPASQFENLLPAHIRIFPAGGKKDLELGMDVFIPGLFTQYSGTDRNIPLIRTGHIAMYPAEKIKSGGTYIDAFLIEARSTGGLSGSPVLYDSTTFGGLRGPNTQGVLGIIHGHWRVGEDDAPEDIHPDADMDGTINMGIAIVTPAIKVWETLTLQQLIEEREAAEKKVTPTS